MMSSGDDFETASDEDLVREVEKELNDYAEVTNNNNSGSLAGGDVPSAYVPDFPETRGLLTGGRKRMGVRVHVTVVLLLSTKNSHYVY